MRKVLLAVSLVTLGFAGLAQAQATRTWVSGVGDDVNPCSRTAPCKTFAGAISKTASPGIINCLDPGGYGAVTVVKSITIDCSATMGSALTSSGANDIVINAQTTDKVVLRGLDINGAGVALGLHGVNIIQAKSVSLFNDRIATFRGNGVQAVNTSNAISVFIENCQILNSNNGIFMNPTGSGSVKLTVADTFISGHNANGIDSVGNTDAYVVRSTITSNGAAGFIAEQSSDSSAIESTLVSGNATGLQAGSTTSSAIYLSRSMVIRNIPNGIVLGPGGSTVLGFQNNVVANNGGSNTISSTAQQ